MSSHRAYQMYAHITWHTWERVGCIDTDAVQDIRSALVSASKATGIRVLQHNELADHVHLLLSFSPRHRLCDFLRQVKSVASFRAGRRVTGAVKWARGYYVATYHKKDLPKVANYIARQHERHPDLIPKQSKRLLNAHQGFPKSGWE